MLEEQFLKALGRNLTSAAIWTELAAEFEIRVREAVKAHAEAVKRSTKTPADYDGGIAEVEGRIARIEDAVEKLGMSDRWQARYQLAEKELEDPKRERAIMLEPVPVADVTASETRDFLEPKGMEIASVLAGDPVLGKKEVQKRVSKLRLDPIETDKGKAYQITGDISLFSSGDEGVMVAPSLSKSTHLYPSLSMPICETILCSAQSRRLRKFAAAA